MKRHLIAGGILALMLATSSCTPINKKTESAPFSPPLIIPDPWIKNSVNKIC